MDTKAVQSCFIGQLRRQIRQKSASNIGRWDNGMLENLSRQFWWTICLWKIISTYGDFMKEELLGYDTELENGLFKVVEGTEKRPFAITVNKYPSITHWNKIVWFGNWIQQHATGDWYKVASDVTQWEIFTGSEHWIFWATKPWPIESIRNEFVKKFGDREFLTLSTSAFGRILWGRYRTCFIVRLCFRVHELIVCGKSRACAEPFEIEARNSLQKQSMQWCDFVARSFCICSVHEKRIAHSGSIVASFYSIHDYSLPQTHRRFDLLSISVKCHQKYLNWRWLRLSLTHELLLRMFDLAKSQYFEIKLVRYTAFLSSVWPSEYSDPWRSAVNARIERIWGDFDPSLMWGTLSVGLTIPRR